MTVANQNFTIYQGDAALLLFTIVDGNGNAIDLSGVSDIVWAAQRDLNSSPVVRKTMTGGGITFKTDGTDGKFQVSLTGTDTTALTGFYLHAAVTIDGSGNASTAATGRMQVGRAPVWTYSGDPANSDRDAVRNYVNDTDQSNPQIMDAEIDYLLAQYPNPLLAAAAACRKLAARWATKVNKRVGDLAISFSDISKNYTSLATELEAQGNTRGLAPYSGGTSIADKISVDQNTDRPSPPFCEKQFDNPSGVNNTSDLDGGFGCGSGTVW